VKSEEPYAPFLYCSAPFTLHRFRSAQFGVLVSGKKRTDIPVLVAKPAAAFAQKTNLVKRLIIQTKGSFLDQA